LVLGSVKLSQEERGGPNKIPRRRGPVEEMIQPDAVVGVAPEPCPTPNLRDLTGGGLGSGEGVEDEEEKPGSQPRESEIG